MEMCTGRQFALSAISKCLMQSHQFVSVGIFMLNIVSVNKPSDLLKTPGSYLWLVFSAEVKSISM